MTSSDIKYNAAVSLFLGSKFSEAAQAFEQILAESPQDVNSIVYLSRSIQETNAGSTRVLQLLKEAFRLNSTNPYTIFTLGCYYFRRHSFRSSIKYFLETLKFEDTHSGAAYNLGVCYDSIGDFQKSTEYYSLAIQLDPKNAKALTNQAIALNKLGENGKAKELLEDALKLNENAKIYNNLGFCLKKLGDGEKAMRFYEKACLLDPEYSIAHYNIAVQLSEEDKMEKAAEHYRKALEIEPANVFACLAAANSIESRGKLNTALKVYESIKSVFPTMRGISDKIGNLKVKLDKIQSEALKKSIFKMKEDFPNFFEWSEDTCIKVLDVDPESLEANLQIGIIYADKKEYSGAETYLNKVLTLKKDFYPHLVYNKLGEITFRSKKDYNSARNLFLQSIKAYETAEVWIKCGKCLEKQKKFEDACADYEKAISLDDENYLAYYKLGWSLVRIGNRTKGVEVLEKALELNPGNSEILTKLGEVIVREGTDLEKAVKFLEAALRNNPSNPDTLVALGRALEKLDRVDEAATKYEAALLLPITNINAYFYLGVIHEKRKDFKKSITLFKKCLHLDRSHFSSALHLATMLANTGEDEKAQKYFKYAIKLEPDSVPAHFNLGKLLHASPAHIDEAADHYKIVINLDNQHYRGLCQLGIYYLEKKQFKQSVEYLQKSIQIHPSFLLSQLSMGNVLVESGSLDSALKYYQKALEISPNEIQALVGMGNALYQLEKPLDSIAYFEKALAIDNELADIHYNLGNAYYLKHDVKRAIEHYETSIRISPDKSECFYNLGNALVFKGRLEAAVDAFYNAIRLDSSNAASYYNLGNALYMQDKFDGAIEAYENSLKISPGSSECHYNLASVYLDKANTALAFEHFGECARLDPMNPEPILQCGAILLKQNKIEEARAKFQKTLEIKPDSQQALDYLKEISNLDQ